MGNKDKIDIDIDKEYFNKERENDFYVSSWYVLIKVINLKSAVQDIKKEINRLEDTLKEVHQEIKDIKENTDDIPEIKEEEKKLSLSHAKIIFYFCATGAISAFIFQFLWMVLK